MGVFRGRAIQITAYAFLNEKCFPQARIGPKENGRLGTTGVRSSSRPDTPKILVIDLALMSNPVNMHISKQYCLRAVLYCVYRCCLANIETTLGLFYKTHISEIRKILLNCFISQFNFIRHSYLHVLISVLSKDKCYYTILCKNCSILSKQYRITNTEQH